MRIIVKLTDLLLVVCRLLLVAIGASVCVTLINLWKVWAEAASEAARFWRGRC